MKAKMENNENAGRTCQVVQPPPERADFLYLMSVIGPEDELDEVIRYLNSPFVTNSIELPAFDEKEALGKTALIINLKDYSVYKTEVGIQVGEYKRFYLPADYPALVKELMDEAKRIKMKNREQSL